MLIPCSVDRYSVVKLIFFPCDLECIRSIPPLATVSISRVLLQVILHTFEPYPAKIPDQIFNMKDKHNQKYSYFTKPPVHHDCGLLIIIPKYADDIGPEAVNCKYNTPKIRWGKSYS